MKNIILSIILLFSSSAFAQWDTWADDEQRMFVASNIAIVADWATTRNMTSRWNEGYYEKNVILGPYPSRDRVDLYFIGLLAANYYVADYFGKYKIYYFVYRTATHGAAAINNHNIGLRLSF